MIQISDLMIYLIRKFLEIEGGYKPGARDEVRGFFAGCFAKILPRVRWSTLIDVPGREEAEAHALLENSLSKHRPQWKRHYNLPAD
jgi:hypothetical protein